MNIRLLEDRDQADVKSMMASHPLQFPPFIIAQYPTRWSSFLAQKDPKISGFYVAHENHICAHAGYIFDTEKDVYEIVGVVVHKDDQRKGIGKALLDTICSKVQLLGGDKVTLSTLGHIGNEATLKFYQSLSYEQVSFEKDFYTKDYHKVTFIKRLNNAY